MRLFQYTEKSSNTIGIVMSKSYDGIKLTPFGYDELIQRKSEKIQDESLSFTKKFIDDHIDEMWFRGDRDLLDICNKYGEKAISNGIIREIPAINMLDILDDARVYIVHDDEDDKEHVNFRII